MQELHLYNTLTRQKERFEPLNPPHVGLYVCGPTVYGDPHLGHARSAVVFDILFRYLKFLDYRVRYVRNITDVGHLENDADEGEDKIAKRARVEQVEPMEVAQLYADRYLHFMDLLGVERPSIQPRATGHIIEQVRMIQRILDNGYAYVQDGSVYFDVGRYNEHYRYGLLSGREDLEALTSGSRELEGQQEKRHSVDFALWKKAKPEHIMQWPSPWSEGFPGWHIECSAMSTKYLGDLFDIHGGGLDLMFPHHEAEIAQSNACHHPHHGADDARNQARYWLHNNMITINGQKMGKSLGNFITLEQLFSGEHPKLEQAYHPMTVRFFILQAHYRSTLDFSNEALQAAEKGLAKLLQALRDLDRLTAADSSSLDVSSWRQELYAALNDDLNTAVAIAGLFEGAKWVNQLLSHTANLAAEDLATFRQTFRSFLQTVLGLQDLQQESADLQKLDAVLGLLIELRQEARRNKDFAQADAIRDRLAQVGIVLRDGPEGVSWSLE